MIKVTVYGREDCHLCDEVLAYLESLKKEYPHELLYVNIDNDPDLLASYDVDIPVVEIGAFKLKAPISHHQLNLALDAAQTQQGQNPSAQNKEYVKTEYGSSWSFADDFAYWISKHYLAVFNIAILIYVGLPFIAPVMMHTGVELPARFIYKGYGLMCHQLAYRSVFLFGEQTFYPRESADIDGALTYAQATGLSEGDNAADRFEARDYLGDENVGYKVALCQRDVGIYGGILLFGLLFGITGKRIPGLPWYLWVLFGIIPLGIDGMSQLISQPPLNFIPYRESVPILRLLTGFSFGFTTAWFGYPLIENSMKETREIMKLKKARLKP